MSLNILEDTTFDDYQDILSDDVKNQIDSDENTIFITPHKGWRESDKWLYPKETADFVKFINQEDSKKAVYLSEPKDILSLNSIDSYLPIITLGFNFVQNVGVGLIVDLIISYLKIKYPRIFSNDDDKIHFKLQLEKSDKKSIMNLEYDGPAKEIKNTFTKEKISELMNKL